MLRYELRISKYSKNIQLIRYNIVYELTVWATFFRISWINKILKIEAIKDVNRSANVEQNCIGYRNIVEAMYSPGSVVIFGSH